MMRRTATANRILVGLILLLSGTQLACNGHDESESVSQGPNLESRRLAREKYEQGARVFQENEGSVSNLRSALDLFEEAIALDSTLVEAHVGIGGVYRTGVYYGWFEESSNLGKARASLERAIALDPTHMPAYTGLLRVEGLGDVEGMLQVGDRARSAGGPAHETRMVRAWAYLFAGMPDLALILIDSASPEVSAPHSDPEQHFLLSISLLWAEHYEAAIREGNSFLEAFGEDATMHFVIAISHHCLGDLKAARIHYEKGLELFGTSSNNFTSIYAGFCYEDLGLAQEAQRVWREASLVLKNRLALVEENYWMRFLLDAYGTLLGDMTESPVNTKPIAEPGLSLLVGALARRGRSEDAVRVIDRMPSGAVVLRSLAPALGIRDIESPPFQEALERLEKREARLRELYGPL